MANDQGRSPDGFPEFLSSMGALAQGVGLDIPLVPQMNLMGGRPLEGTDVPGSPKRRGRPRKVYRVRRFCLTAQEDPSLDKLLTQLLTSPDMEGTYTSTITKEGNLVVAVTYVETIWGEPPKEAKEDHKEVEEPTP